MMKNYHLYVFSQDGCEPCDRLKKYVNSLPDSDKKELDFVPMRVKRSSMPYAPAVLTALAEEHNINATPTLLVVHEEVSCSIEDDDEWCDPLEVEVERIVGANAIIEHLDATIDAYTYAHPE